MKAKNIGNHTVRGVPPGGSITFEPDEAYQLARQGVIGWGFLHPPKRKKKTDDADTADTEDED